MSSRKRSKVDAGDADEVETLEQKLASDSAPYFASKDALASLQEKKNVFPVISHPASHVKEFIFQEQELDFKPRLNTSSYVNVVFEDEEQQVAQLGATVNIADGSVYPASIRMHDAVVGMIGDLWHVPGAKEGVDVSGAGTVSVCLIVPLLNFTVYLYGCVSHFRSLFFYLSINHHLIFSKSQVGSTEACLLAGLAHKFRWRKWYAARHGLSAEQVVGVKPNMVISTCFQAAWEKLFKYFDVTPKFVKPRLANNFSIDAKELVSQCDEKTIAVVGILGNHYNGAYDPIWEIDAELGKLNAEKGFQIGIHVDAASGGFIAPFQDGLPPFDFRLPNVLSMSASGHKFGLSVCGTGWVVFRQRADLAEHISISVSYLGGQCDSMTLNFSRPASGPYVQLYKFLRLGRPGYRSVMENEMAVAAFIRAELVKMMHPSGKPRFQILDGGDEKCLPVVGARLNPDCGMNYDDIDLQHALAER